MQQTYSPVEAATKLGFSRAYIYKLVQKGKLKPIRTKPLLFTEEEIKSYCGSKNSEPKKEG